MPELVKKEEILFLLRKGMQELNLWMVGQKLVTWIYNNLRKNKAKNITCLAVDHFFTP